jgi:hypothetical protein
MNDFKEIDLNQLASKNSENTNYPDLINGKDFLSKEIIAPPPIIEGLLRSKELAVLSGESKSNKSWASLQLGVSVSNGLKFWEMSTNPNRVLLVNTELQEATLNNRIKKINSEIEKCTNIKPKMDDFWIWNLRNIKIGNCFFKELYNRCEDNGIGLVILDPLYPLLGDRDENSNGQMAELLSEVRGYCEAAGAAVWITHHFAKGNSATKKAIDRGSGAGAISRFADSVISLSRHVRDSQFVLESSLRSFGPMSPLVLRWEYPLLSVVNGENVNAIKGGNYQKITWAIIRKYLTDGMTRQALAKKVAECEDVGLSTVRKKISSSIDCGDVIVKEGALYAAPQVLTFSGPGEGPVPDQRVA